MFELVGPMRRTLVGALLLAHGAAHVVAGTASACIPDHLGGHAGALLLGAAPGFAAAGLGLLGVVPLRGYVRLATRLAAAGSTLLLALLSLPVLAIFAGLVLNTLAVLFVAWSVKEVRAHTSHPPA